MEFGCEWGCSVILNSVLKEPASKVRSAFSHSGLTEQADLRKMVAGSGGGGEQSWTWGKCHENGCRERLMEFPPDIEETISRLSYTIGELILSRLGEAPLHEIIQEVNRSIYFGFVLAEHQDPARRFPVVACTSKRGIEFLGERLLSDVPAGVKVNIIFTTTGVVEKLVAQLGTMRLATVLKLAWIEAAVVGALGMNLCSVQERKSLHCKHCVIC